MAGRRETRIPQPCEEQVRIHSIATCHLRHGNARRARLPTDLAFLLVRPEPLLLPFPSRHGVPQDIHYRSWTLSAADRHRQSSFNGRIRLSHDRRGTTPACFVKNIAHQDPSSVHACRRWTVSARLLPPARFSPDVLRHVLSDVVTDVSYGEFVMRGEILGVERRRRWSDVSV